jgi:hypothetical protein
MVSEGGHEEGADAAIGGLGICSVEGDGSGGTVR